MESLRRAEQQVQLQQAGLQQKDARHRPRGKILIPMAKAAAKAPVELQLLVLSGGMSGAELGALLSRQEHAWKLG